MHPTNKLTEFNKKDLQILLVYFCSIGFCVFVFTGIRSVNFNLDMLSIGTGNGAIYFYDLRANKYLDQKCGHTLALNASKGWLVSERPVFLLGAICFTAKKSLYRLTISALFFEIQASVNIATKV